MNELHDSREMRGCEANDHEARTEAAWRAALQHQQPPPGFASRVEEKIHAQAAANARSNGWRILHPDQAWLRIAIAAVLLVAMVLPLGLRLHYQARLAHQAQLAKGEAARDQVLLALRITGTQLRSIQHRTRFINTSPLAGDSQ